MAAPAVAWFEITGNDGASLQRLLRPTVRLADPGRRRRFGLRPVPAAEKGSAAGSALRRTAGPARSPSTSRSTTPPPTCRRPSNSAARQSSRQPRSSSSASRSRSSRTPKATSSASPTGRSNDRPRQRQAADRDERDNRDHRRVHARDARQEQDLYRRAAARDREGQRARSWPDHLGARPAQLRAHGRRANSRSSAPPPTTATGPESTSSTPPPKRSSRSCAMTPASRPACSPTSCTQSAASPPPACHSNPIDHQRSLASVHPRSEVTQVCSLGRLSGSPNPGMTLWSRKRVTAAIWSPWRVSTIMPAACAIPVSGSRR